MQLPAPIADLALILCVAGFTCLVCRWLKQPLVLGYLVAGILVGPEIRFVPNVTELEHLNIWSELGVIFLLFLLGMEFSFKKLFRVGIAPVVAATVEVTGMLVIGYFVGRILGWNFLNSLFLGGVLSISSTTIIVKAFDDLGARPQQFASTVIGILIIEDLYAILILALLGTFAATQSFSGADLLFQVGKLGMFLAFVIPFGLWLLPRSLKLFHRYLTDETRVVISVGSCLGCVYLATSVGFSAALGAFLMGAFIAETLEGERQERILKPIRDLFGAVFFTSVGMLVDMSALRENWQTVAIISLATIVGKTVTSGLGMRLGRADKDLSLQTGLSLAQIGEFSFIIVSLGLSLKVIDPKLYPITVAVSVITTFLTPYFIKLAMARTGTTTKRHRKHSKVEQLGHVIELEVHPHYQNVGETLEKLKLKERFGVTVVSIRRGDRHIISPTRHESFMPFDRLMIFGGDTQLAAMAKHLRTERHDITAADEGAYGLERYVIPGNSSLVDRTILDCQFREKIDGLILAIEREGKRWLNPEAKQVLASLDVIWLYGSLEKIRTFMRNPT